MSLATLILDHLESLGHQCLEKDGTVFVLTPLNRVYEFSLPRTFGAMQQQFDTNLSTLVTAARVAEPTKEMRLTAFRHAAL